MAACGTRSSRLLSSIPLATLRRRPFADLVDHAAPQHQERDVRHALGHSDRHRFLRRDLPPGTSDGSGACRRSTSTICTQQTLAGYFQQTVGLLPTTDFSYGGRVQNTSLSARDRYDPNSRPVSASSIAAPRRPAGQRGSPIRPAYRSRASLQQYVLGIWPRRPRVPHARMSTNAFRAGRLSAPPSSLRFPATSA